MGYIPIDTRLNLNYDAFWNAHLSSHGRQRHKHSQVITVEIRTNPEDWFEVHITYYELKKDFQDCVKKINEHPEMRGVKLGPLKEAFRKFMRNVEEMK